MEEHYFLFGLAFIWTVFAIFQDFKTREIANWLNFSLIAFVLAYRAFYSVSVGDIMFFVYGVVGISVFIFLAYLFYYQRVFAGGDAKLLMGIGGFLPYDGFGDYILVGFGFIFILFLSGAVYTLVYTLFLINKNIGVFKAKFREEIARTKYLLILFLMIGVLIEVLNFFSKLFYFGLIFLVFICFYFLYVYVKAVDKGIMIKKVSPDKLTVGDWLEEDVRVGKKTISKSVHGLSKEDIYILKRARKKVLIKDGVPFSPAFLIALILMAIVLRYFSF